ARPLTALLKGFHPTLWRLEFSVCWIAVVLLSRPACALGETPKAHAGKRMFKLLYG
ncbi:MAG: hypothetical protein ACI9WR_001516, partial [Paracoccaceae bacterium]